MFPSRLPLVSLLSCVLLSTATPIPPSQHRAAANAPIIWDGRVPTNFSKLAFDSASTSPFNPTFVRATNESFSQILEFPNVSPSLFDGRTSRPIEVTINDKSIFSPGGNPQNGFRRAELLPITNNGTDATVQGITTLHFSIQEDPTKSLNYTHEYQLVFIETNDFASHEWTLKTGTPFGTDPASFPEEKAKTLRLGSSTAGGAAEVVLFETPLDTGVWYNFAIQIDWDKSTITAFFSTNNSPLKEVVSTRPNNSTGKGQAHIGVLKLPTLPSTNPSQNGVQEPGIDEGMIYGGLFVENTSQAPPTLKLC